MTSRPVNQKISKQKAHTNITLHEHTFSACYPKCSVQKTQSATETNTININCQIKKISCKVFFILGKALCFTCAHLLSKNKDGKFFPYNLLVYFYKQDYKL